MADYPKLLWHGETTAEITVTSGEEEAEKLAAGYVRVQPPPLPPKKAVLPVKAADPEPVANPVTVVAHDNHEFGTKKRKGKDA